MIYVVKEQLFIHTRQTYFQSQNEMIDINRSYIFLNFRNT